MCLAIYVPSLLAFLSVTQTSQTNLIPKTSLCKTLLYLYHKDVNSAVSQLESAAVAWPEIVKSKEYQVGAELVEAWQAGNAEEFNKLIKSSTITYLPVEFARLSRNIEIPASLIRQGSAGGAGAALNEGSTPDEIADQLL